MFLKKLIGLLSLSLTVNLSALASEPSTEIFYKKYVNADKIELSKEKILLLDEELGALFVDQLMIDEKGLYVIINDKEFRDPLGTWTCYRNGCFTLNSAFQLKCRKCGSYPGQS